MTHDPTSTTGIILAGGLSRRMGGGDKGLLDIAGKPMLAHVIDRLRPQVGHMAINANGDPARFAAFGLPVVPDTIDGFVGPLAGVLAGMRWSAAHAPATGHIATVSADAPLLPHTLVAQIEAALAGSAGRIGLAKSGGELHPVIGVWPVDLADDLQAALEAGVRKVLAWTDRHGTVAVEFDFCDIDGASIDPFFNANTPDELDQARRLLGA